MKRSWLWAALVVGGVACSLANSPDDPVPPPGTSTAGGSGGDGGQAGGQAGGGTGGQGGGPLCPNGVEEGDEQCDEGGDTADCDGDCTLVECSDGYLNRAAGEQCDDGNGETGDACDVECKVTPFDIDADPFPYSGPSALIFGGWPAVGLTTIGDEEHFLAVWTHELWEGSGGGGGAGGASGEWLPHVKQLAYRANGQPVPSSEAQLDVTSGGPSPHVASNHLGRSVVTWVGDDDQVHFRVVHPEAEPGGSTDMKINDSDPYGARPRVQAAFSGQFCITWLQDMGNPPEQNQVVHCLNEQGTSAGQTRAVGLSDAPYTSFGTMALWPTQDGFIAARFTDDPRVVTGQLINVTGQTQGESFTISALDDLDVIVGGIGSADDPSFFAAFVADGTFGATQPDGGAAEDQERMLVRPFSEPGTPEGAPSLVGQLHVDEIFPHLARHPSGRFFATWFSELEDNGCVVRGRRFSAEGVPLGPVFDISPPEDDTCSIMARAVANSAGDVMVIYGEFVLISSDPEEYSVKIRAVILPRLLAQ